MLTCLGRLLPSSRNSRHRRLQSSLLCKLQSGLHTPTIDSAVGCRWFSKCGPTQSRHSKSRRREKRQKENLAQEKRPENKNAAPWINSLEPFLQSHLRSSSYHGEYPAQNPEEMSAAILRVIAEARENAGKIDILAELGVKHGRWSAVLSIMDVLISDAAASITSSASAQLPSTLNWPTSAPLDDMAKGPIEISKPSNLNITSSAGWEEYLFDPGSTDKMARAKHKVLEQIWMSLGSIILEAADLPSDQSNHVMVYAYQIIARLHNSGFVPDHVYSYVRTSYDSAVRRPPIMHLLSSRILTTLSDAVWRAHQNEVITQAVAAGASYRDVGHDPPGGRFRLKVRELGTEVWLEFVLWCCVDGGFATAGSWIIERMRTRHTDSPWFAARWTSASGDGASEEAMIDWARVKLRHGGTVGQIEGYCVETPFVEMEGRTISVEVVLALVEASINARSPDAGEQGRTHESAQTSISQLLMFLEPHGLPPKYFDYLTVRLLQPLLLDLEKNPKTLQSLVDILKSLRSLETTHKPAEYLPSLEFGSVLEQSEVFVGVLHQTLEALAVVGWVRPTVEMFSHIQHLVDQSKLRSIGSFLQDPSHPGQSSISSRDSDPSLEYASSYGQLPAQKLAPLLDVVTDARLDELGQWLFYSMDVDGPLIPLSLYGRSSLTPSALRFAAVTRDSMLIQDIANTVNQRPSKPPVSFLRSFADARLHLTQDFENAGEALAALTAAKGGGNSLSNVAKIIATIIRIELSIERTAEERRHRLLSPALALLDWVLHGDFRGNAGYFRKDHVSGYRRGLACLLRVVEAIPGTITSNVARSWIPTLGQGNVVGLNARVFDIILSAVVETKGAKVGMILWDLFCTELTDDDEHNQGWLSAAHTELVSTERGVELRAKDSPSRFGGWSRSKRLPIRLQRPRSTTTNFYAGGHLEMDSTSDDAMLASEHGAETSEEDDDAFLAIEPEATDDTGNDAATPPLSDISIEHTVLSEGSHSLPDKSFVHQQQNMDLPITAPSADVSLPFPADFNTMISEESVPENSEHDDVSPINSSASLPSPVVRPTFRTLRIILRAALQDLEIAKSLRYTETPEVPLNTTEEAGKANMRVLEAAMTDAELVDQWAQPIFRKFGINKDDIAQEFGWSLGEKGNMFSTAELRKRFAAEKTEYELAKMGLLADLSEVEIRKRFLGPPVRYTKTNVHKYSTRELKYYFGKDLEREPES
jgi:hypothetical protein